MVFIFSGFVKGVDPLGTAYRIEDYFVAFHMPWAVQFALFLSILLCTVEFILGISMLFNLWIRYTAWILLPMMIFFALLTLNDAIFNPVPDCGCFGDALKLTNIQTFLKNIVLMGLIIPIFAWRKKFKSLFPGSMEFSFLILFIVLFSGFSICCYRHLPFIDFMKWKVGNVVNKEKRLPVKFYLTYKNKKTGEEKEYLSSNYPWNDPKWVSEWEFKSQRADDPNKPDAMVLRIEDLRGNDQTRTILDNPDPQFILVAYDLTKTNTKAFNRILPLYKKAEASGYSFICLTSAISDEIKKFKLRTGTSFEYDNADDAVLKTMVRSNPGLILMKNGKVLAKWGWRDIPHYDEAMKKLKIEN